MKKANKCFDVLRKHDFQGTVKYRGQNYEFSTVGSEISVIWYVKVPSRVGLGANTRMFAKYFSAEEEVLKFLKARKQRGAK